MAATRTTLEAMQAQMNSAACPEDVFGLLVGNAGQQRESVKKLYMQLSRACHPDLVGRDEASLAADVFGKLSNWRTLAEGKIEAGTYGDRRPVSPSPPPTSYTPIEMEVRGKQLVTTQRLGTGTFADIHAVTLEGFDDGAAFLKVARDPADNDLLEREWTTLRRLAEEDPRPEIEDFLLKQRAYAPRPLDTFLVPGATGAKHRGIVLSIPQGRAFTAATLRREKFPAGIEPRHVWWIFRRLLLTAWMAHLKGMAHGAITPDHVLVYPEAHGLVLLDWTCAAEIGDEHVPAINEAYRAFYPPEVFAKKLATAALDLYMAAATAVDMLGGDPVLKTVPASVPAETRAALLRCLDPNPRRRPQDAEAFHNDFGSLLGPRRYAEFVVP